MTVQQDGDNESVTEQRCCSNPCFFLSIELEAVGGVGLVTESTALCSLGPKRKSAFHEAAVYFMRRYTVLWPAAAQRSSGVPAVGAVFDNVASRKYKS